MFPLLSAGGKRINYQIANSLRFQSASSQYLSRTTGTSTSQTTWTVSCWFKRGTLGVSQQIFSAGGGSTNNFFSEFQTDDTLWFYYPNTATFSLHPTQVFRDPAAWYHLVFVYDSTQATASNRIKIYINGVQITSFSTATYPALNATTTWNGNATAQAIGRYLYTSAEYFDGYMSEFYNIDGQALTPSSFGTTDPTSGQWVAAKYTGTYGTNGFYLPFSNGTSTTTLGADSSGNGNNWTLTNFTRSAGVSDCWMTDVPSGNGGASGTQPNSNYATLNPLGGISTVTLSNANLNASITGNTSYNNQVRATIGMTAGNKYYFEFTNNGGALPAAVEFGVADASVSIALRPDTTAESQVSYQAGGNKNVNGTASAYGATYTTGDVIGCAVDMAGGTITFYKNNTSQGAISLPSTSVTLVPYFYHNSGSSNSAAYFNSGIRSFAYTPPSGFKALCTANLPASTILQGNKYMDATLYTGTGATLSVTNAGSFKPDFVWMKSRSAATDHALFDSVRGTTLELISDSTAAETTQATGLTAFNANGWTIGAEAKLNTNAATYVGWQWQAGQGSTSSNTNGSITSTTSVNATAGFSVVTYTGTGANATVGHGLGVAPKMIIVKSRSSAQDWPVGHSSLTSWAYNLALDLTAAQGNNPTVWNSTAPTSSVFSLGTNVVSNQSTITYVAYCFAEIAGFSKFGSYTGNGSADGPFVYLGFRPKYILSKCATTGGAGCSWNIFDSSRTPYNQAQGIVWADSSTSEDTSTSYPFDLLSNGFKLRNATGTDNINGQTYIYMAFAENPFAQANAR